MAAPTPLAVLADVLAGQAAVRPEAVAVSFEGADLRYRELDHASRDVAALAWHDWGVRPGDRVAWLGANHPAQLILLFALARLGAILVPLNFRLALPEWETLVAGCGPRHLVHDAAWTEAARELARRTALALHAAESLPNGNGKGGTAPRAPATSSGRPESAALLVHTSGTTGGPKAAMHTQANLLANMAIAAQVQQLAPTDTVATLLPLFHVGGLCIQTLPALFAGARVLLHQRFDADAAIACFEQDRPTLTLLVPATMKALVEHPRWKQADLTSLRAVWAGSSLIPAALVDAFHQRGLPVCNVYGATETGPFSIALPPACARSHAGSCGWPAPGVEVRIDAPSRGVGELLIRGPNVVAAYWPAEPACDPHGWFHSGDLGMQAADGSYSILGRAKDLIISGGENIHPAEIESLLSDHPGVRECAAFGLPDDRWGEVVAVAVVRQGEGGPTEDELSAFLAGRLARYKQPRHWFWLEALPRTALGKLQRAALASRVSVSR